MAKEIERKFLVHRQPWKKAKLEAEDYFDITQGYLSKSVIHNIRIRVTDDNAVITIKSKARGITRDEFEYEIPRADAVQMLTLCSKPLIEKTRYVINHQGHEWTVDEFKTGPNEGLLMAEIELQDEKEQFVIPKWAGREVTHDKRYTNSYISSNEVEYV